MGPLKRRRKATDKDTVIKVNLSPRPEEGFVQIKDPLKLPWPLKDSSVTLLSAAGIVHRINPVDKGFIKWMDEAWRVLKVGGQMRIATPYGVGAGFISDPCSLNPCTPQTFHYFDPEQATMLYAKYHPKPWKIEPNGVFWQTDGLLEILLSKRADHPGYKKI